MIYFTISYKALMLTGLSGTPGCGKTTCSNIIRDRGYDVRDLNEIADASQSIVDYDEMRDSKEIDVEKMNDYVLNELSDKDVILDGHLSHLLSVDKVIILRCDPLTLKKRLEEKGWSDSKIRENVEAEILDVIKVEAHEEGHEIFEIDTSEKSPSKVADEIENILKGNYEDPKIDWLKNYEYILLESP
jgi:adenylate kinase